MVYTGSVPCDSYTVTFLYDKSMGEALHLAAGFLAVGNGEILLRGIVDGYDVAWTPDGLLATVFGRGYAARLLDNESRPVTYQGVTLEERDLTGAELFRAHLAGVDLSTCTLDGIRLSQHCAELKGARIGSHQAAVVARILGIDVV